MQELLTMLDTKYKRLEYIQSTGTQYIDTGIIPNNETGLRVVIKSNFVEPSNFIGSRVFGSSRFMINWQEGNWNYGFNGFVRTNISANQTIKNDLSLNLYNSKKFDVNGISVDITQTLNDALPTICLFGQNQINPNTQVQNQILHSYKICSAQITQGLTLVRNFIPVMRKSDNEIGMLDLVEGKFYPNAGTGKFTANLDTMYALIQGTPTVQDGRVSNFAYNNYVATNQVLDTSKDFEIVVKVNIGTLKSGFNILLRNSYGENPGSVGFVIGVENNKTKAFLLNSAGGWISSSSGSNGTTILSNNTDYLIRFKQKDTVITIETSSDNGINWTVENTFTISLKIRNSGQGVAFGGGSFSQTTQYWTGTIDLNRSYIKIDDTKYKLQAVVGYSKVGTLTENPTGVFSGFSSVNYLRTSQNINILSNSNRWEIQTAFSVSDLTNSPQMIMGNAYGTANGILFAAFKDTDNTYTLRLYVYNNGALFTAWLTTKFNILIKYYVRIIFTGQQYKILVSDNKINWNEIYSNNIDTNIGISNQYLFFGVDTRGTWSAFTGGQLYVSETIIYQNNKLWFNGLEA